MTILKELRTSPSKNKKFIKACEESDLKAVQSLLNRKNLFFADIHALNDAGFLMACCNGHLDVVKYLLTSPDLPEHADIHADNDLGFLYACGCGHLEIVKYLLKSPDLKDHADIHAYNNVGFRWACKNGHFEIVQYLLTSSDLKEHIPMDDYAFGLACAYGHLNVVTYLLSFNGEQGINFQNTEYGLDWAIENQYDNVILAMMKNLKNNHFMEYLEFLSKIEAYNQELHEQVKNIEIDNLEINSPSKTVLFM